MQDIWHDCIEPQEMRSMLYSIFQISISEIRVNGQLSKTQSHIMCNGTYPHAFYLCISCTCICTVTCFTRVMVHDIAISYVAVYLV